MISLVKSLAVVAVWLASVHVSAGPTRAAEPVFSPPTAEAPLGGPTVFRTTLTADTEPARVEALVTTQGDSPVSILLAELSGGPVTWSAEATLEGHVLANSLLSYHFRAVMADGQRFEGPRAEVRVVDDRFEWRLLEGPTVRLRWYSGEEAFGRRALDIGEQAVSNAASLLGVEESEPIDFFIYDKVEPFYDAIGPATRENVAGRAVASIRTMYGLILPSQVNDEWVDILVTHELTHLVFGTATDNPYHSAPHWLNEGVATYLSEGNAERWKTALRLGAATGSLIPLQGIGATFGAGEQRFDLGYAQSVSAVDYFVRTYGEPKLWELVRSYAEGLSDDDAFSRATGIDLTAFNEDWMESIGATVPPERGPQPGLPGPLPADWTAAVGGFLLATWIVVRRGRRAVHVC